jgi:hypothetical protein
LNISIAFDHLGRKRGAGIVCMRHLIILRERWRYEAAAGTAATRINCV